jgi:hypothetical protein
LISAGARSAKRGERRRSGTTCRDPSGNARGGLERQAHEVAEPDEVVQLDCQIASLQRGIGRLINSYTEGLLDRPEFEPRIAGLKARLLRLHIGP